MSKRRAPPLSDEDRALFRAAMAGVKRQRPEAAAPPPRALPPLQPKARGPKTAPQPKTRLPALAPGSSAGTDASTIRKLTRGQIRPEAVLDLHGHTLARGHAALHGFIARAQARGLRCVIVVTGRGAQDGPSLRAEVPRWLNEPGLRGMILGFSAAQPRDGGAGALYLLLKRARATE